MKNLLVVLLLASLAHATVPDPEPMYPSVFPVQIAVGATDPPTCTPGAIPAERNLFWNSTSQVMKFCSAVNTWTAYADATAATFATMTGCTTDGAGTLTCTVFLGPAQTATNDATKPLAGKAMKWVATNGWTLAVSGTDMNDTSLAIAYANASGSLVRPQAPGSQLSAVSHDPVVTGQYALLYATAGSDGQLTSSAVCLRGQRYLGTWAETNTAGTRTLNYNPGMCSRPIGCDFALGDGTNAVPAATYSALVGCKNSTGDTITFTAFQAFSDNAGTSSCDAKTSHSGTPDLLSGALTAAATFPAADGGGGRPTLTGTTLLATEWLTATIVADGTSKRIVCHLEGK